jgi:hypothetical protein
MANQIPKVHTDHLTKEESLPTFEQIPLTLSQLYLTLMD